MPDHRTAGDSPSPTCPGYHRCAVCGQRWYHAWAACRIRDDVRDPEAQCPTHAVRFLTPAPAVQPALPDA